MRLGLDITPDLVAVVLQAEVAPRVDAEAFPVLELARADALVPVVRADPRVDELRAVQPVLDVAAVDEEPKQVILRLGARQDVVENEPGRCHGASCGCIAGARGSVSVPPAVRYRWIPGPAGADGAARIRPETDAFRVIHDRALTEHRRCGPWRMPCAVRARA